jgi:hypothetical protein
MVLIQQTGDILQEGEWPFFIEIRSRLKDIVPFQGRKRGVVY